RRFDWEEEEQIGAELLDDGRRDLDRVPPCRSRGEALRPDPEDQAAAGVAVRKAPGSEGDAELAEADLVSLERGLDEIHCRCADEARDEEAGRIAVEGVGEADLRDQAVGEDG